MCIADLRIEQGQTFRAFSVTSDANNRAYVPPMRRMVLMWASCPGQSMTLHFLDDAGANRRLPADTGFSVFDSNTGVYSRRSVGPFMAMPCFFLTALPSEVVTVYVYEYDAVIDTAVNALTGGL